MRSLCGFAFMVILTVFTASCSSSDNNTPPVPYAGYYEVGPVSFSFQQAGLPTLDYTSSVARVMVYFFPADSSPQTKPLIVFFNGGPGCATCTGLFSLNTAPYTLDKNRTGSSQYKANPYSFTQLGNLLYVDATNTGFSYNIVENASSQSVRAAEFDARNFNMYLDAAIVIRVLLRFLDDNPAIRGNDVIILGESYGGVRSLMMLNMLLFHNRYKDGSRVYKDVALVNEIQRHYENVFPAYRGQTIPPEVAAAQFGTQILIQPLIAGSNQDTFSGQAYEDPDSVIYEIAAETGKVYTPCSAPGCAPYENALAFVESTAKREIYQYNKPAGYIDEISNFAQAGLDTVSVLSAITGTDVTAMPNLLPSYRGNAYRYIQGRSADIQGIIDGSGFQKLPAAERMAMRRYARLLAEGEQIVEPEAEDTLEKVLGGLNAWDAYIIGCNMTAFETFYENSASRAGYDITPASVSTGNLFLQNLALVRTFITDSDLDLVIYSPAIAGSLETYTAIVDDVVWNAETDDGYIDVFYKPGSLQDVTTPYKRTIHYPRYSQSGHMVSLAQPEKFFNDVKDWLED